MKFQWYVFDSENPGDVKGTNDVDELKEHLTDSRYTILSAQHGIYFYGSRNQLDVEPLIDEDDSEGDDDSPDTDDGDDSPDDDDDDL